MGQGWLVFRVWCGEACGREKGCGGANANEGEHQSPQGDAGKLKLHGDDLEIVVVVVVVVAGYDIDGNDGDDDEKKSSNGDID